MDTGDLLLNEGDVGEELDGTFFTSSFPSPHLGCSSLEVSTTFSDLPCGPARSKRYRTEDELEEHQLQELQSEVKQLRGKNHLLQASFNCIQAKTMTAVDEQRKLLQLVKALQPHKQAFHLRPLESQGSSIGTTGTAAAESAPPVEEDLTETFLALPHSPSKSQPRPAEPFSTPCKHGRRVQSAALPSHRGDAGEKRSRLPSRLEADPQTAHTAAIAAAALAVNAGNPAAALLDLLHLAMTKQVEQKEAAVPNMHLMMHPFQDIVLPGPNEYL